MLAAARPGDGAFGFAGIDPALAGSAIAGTGGYQGSVP